MAWPSVAVAVGEVITAAQMNGLPVRLADSTLAADAASIDFQSIPAIYAHLYLECYLRGTNAAAFIPMNIRFNNDTGANYDNQTLQGSAAVASATEAFAQTVSFIAYAPANGAAGGANLFNAVTVDIPHYANTANNKDYSAQYSFKSGTTTTLLNLGCVAGFWRSSAAINRITIYPTTDNLKSGSRVVLYGLP